jgi:hypothetical protein
LFFFHLEAQNYTFHRTAITVNAADMRLAKRVFIDVPRLGVNGLATFSQVPPNSKLIEKLTKSADNAKKHKAKVARERRAGGN